MLLMWGASKLSDKATIENIYYFPDNKKEMLKNLSYPDRPEIYPLVQVVYEKELFLGLKCMVTIKDNDENTELFDLEEIYKEINDKKNTGFCKVNLDIYKNKSK